MSKDECCGKNGCKCHNGQNEEKIGVCNFLGKFTVVFLWVFILFNAFTLAFYAHGVKRNKDYSQRLQDRLNQPIYFICPHSTDSIDSIDSTESADIVNVNEFLDWNSETTSDCFDLEPVVRITVVSEKQKYVLSKCVNPSITHTEEMPDGTQITVEIE
jgi:preprotein translocase subunit SecG